MSAIGTVRAAALAAAVGLSGFAGIAMGAPTNGFVDPQALSLMPGSGASAQLDRDMATASGADLPANGSESNPLMMDAAAAEAPNIHGFIEVPFKIAYVTPRGLVVEYKKGLIMEPVAGMVFPIGDLGPVKNLTFVTGIWNNIDTAQGDHFVGAWNELDYFASISGSVGKITATGTYSPWYSPPHNFQIEHTADLKIAYDDTGLISKDFAIHPYLDVFWSIAGDSTVILGRRGSTYYGEFGIAPSYTLTPAADWPITFTFPTYFSVGPSHFWTANGNGNNFGVASTAINLSVPLKFIPPRYGFWHADAGVQYFYLLNGTLLDAGTLSSGNTSRNVINASVGFGVNF